LKILSLFFDDSLDDLIYKRAKESTLIKKDIVEETIQPLTNPKYSINLLRNSSFQKPINLDNSNDTPKTPSFRYSSPMNNEFEKRLSQQFNKVERQQQDLENKNNEINNQYDTKKLSHKDNENQQINYNEIEQQVYEKPQNDNNLKNKKQNTTKKKKKSTIRK